jgi:hypothetical protein
MFSNIFVGSRLRGRSGKFYGITMLYRKDPKSFREDLPKIFALLAEKKFEPLINRVFPLLEARQALEFLATGHAEGKIVLSVNPWVSRIVRLRDARPGGMELRRDYTARSCRGFTKLSIPLGTTLLLRDPLGMACE